MQMERSAIAQLDKVGEYEHQSGYPLVLSCKIALAGFGILAVFSREMKLGYKVLFRKTS
jgi:hypothetical protein